MKTMAAGFLLVLIPLVVAWVVAESARSRVRHGDPASSFSGGSCSKKNIRPGPGPRLAEPAWIYSEHVTRARESYTPIGCSG